MEKRLKILSYLVKYYASNWKEAFLKAITKNWLCFYYIVYWVIFLRIEEGITAIFPYLGLFLPLILGSLHSVMFPNRLDKTMFLCPIENRERKLFLIFGYWFRVGCVCFASILIILFMLAIGILKYSVYLIVFFICEVMAAIVIFLMTYTEESRKNGDKIWMWASWIVNMISCLFFGNIVWEYSMESLEGWEIVFIVILFIIQVPLFLKVMISCWRKEMEIAVDYEKNFLFQQNKESEL